MIYIQQINLFDPEKWYMVPDFKQCQKHYLRQTVNFSPNSKLYTLLKA